MNRMDVVARWAVAIILAAGLVACGDDDRGGPGGGEDAGTIDVDGGATGDDGGAMMTTDLSCGDIPSEGFGTRVGGTLEPFTLDSCTEDGEYSFYNEEWCDSSLTVISIAAGWCPPCIVESRELTDRVTEAYRDRGVRVIQVLVQDEEYRAPDITYCEEWVDRFGLTNIELIDPTGVTQIYFPGNSLPSTIIVDNEGTIRFRENGATEGLVSLTNELDDLLEEMGL